MLKKKSVYLCNCCGNIVESVWDGSPSISCCGQEMEELTLNTKEAATEKHIPEIKREGKTLTVTVGSVEHPMANDHYILFIEILDGDYVYRKDLKPGDTPTATFTVQSDKVTARAFCNLHGFWSAEG